MINDQTRVKTIVVFLSWFKPICRWATPPTLGDLLSWSKLKFRLFWTTHACGMSIRSTKPLDGIFHWKLIITWWYDLRSSLQVGIHCSAFLDRAFSEVWKRKDMNTAGTLGHMQSPSASDQTPKWLEIHQVITLWLNAYTQDISKHHKPMEHHHFWWEQIIYK